MHLKLVGTQHLFDLVQSIVEFELVEPKQNKVSIKPKEKNIIKYGKYLHSTHYPRKKHGSNSIEKQ